MSLHLGQKKKVSENNTRITFPVLYENICCGYPLHMFTGKESRCPKFRVNNTKYSIDNFSPRIHYVAYTLELPCWHDSED